MATARKPTEGEKESISSYIRDRIDRIMDSKLQPKIDRYLAEYVKRGVRLEVRDIIEELRNEFSSTKHEALTSQNQTKYILENHIGMCSKEEVFNRINSEVHKEIGKRIDAMTNNASVMQASVTYFRQMMQYFHDVAQKNLIGDK